MCIRDRESPAKVQRISLPRSLPRSLPPNHPPQIRRTSQLTPVGQKSRQVPHLARGAWSSQRFSWWFSRPFITSSAITRTSSANASASTSKPLLPHQLDGKPQCIIHHPFPPSASRCGADSFTYSPPSLPQHWPSSPPVSYTHLTLPTNREV